MIRKSFLFIFCGSLLLSCNTVKKNSSEISFEQLIDDQLKFAVEQVKRLDTSFPDTLFPRSYEKNELINCESSWWTSGFFPGSLWYLYEYSGDNLLFERAKARTVAVEKEQYNTHDHDLGFKMYCSFGNGLRLTGNEEYIPVMMQGAKSLISRFNETVGLIMSWNPSPGKGWHYPVIIDNMMNLEYLFWATRQSGDSVYFDVAVRHADNTLKHHFREDNSSYHVVSYNPETGEPEVKQTAQGFSDSSAWARGQAWGFYGYVMSFRETGYQRYLDQAVKIAGFILSHPNLPEDKIPYWDFDTPDSLSQYRDASAAAILCSGLIELSQYVDDGERYIDNARKILRSLSRDPYIAEADENGNFILKHSVGSIPHWSEVDVPLSYADYYYIESLIRIKRLLNNEVLIKQ